jgi:hypothetical protein
MRFGADEATAASWSLLVDGLLTTATVELWKNDTGRRAACRWPVGGVAGVRLRDLPVAVRQRWRRPRS